MKADYRSAQLDPSENAFSSILVAISAERIGEQMVEKGRKASYILLLLFFFLIKTLLKNTQGS